MKVNVEWFWSWSYTWMHWPFAHTVPVEAVKCLCNILLNNRHLAPTLDQLGCLSALTQRLNLCHNHKLPYELIQFDLRFLFLITACGASERYEWWPPWLYCQYYIVVIINNTPVCTYTTCTHHCCQKLGFCPNNIIWIFEHLKCLISIANEAHQDFFGSLFP